ncbi:rRNA maturation RNase YbeY [Alphaproteobacteria bacterium]|nr:rRNA maturation RNase YbeY [Alphaproteobacteria bacterium]
MKSEMNNGDSTLEPDSPEDNQFLSDEWTSEGGALIDVSIDISCWHNHLIADLKKRGPVMLDQIASRLSLDPQIVSLLLCNDVDMHSMNFLHRGFDKSTNVLSFPAGDDLYLNDDMPEMDGGIGDIAIAGEMVMREAAEAGIAAGDHLLHLFTHGVLHLLGYDHIDDQMAGEMEALEIALLSQMKIANPYLCDELALGTRETG